MVAPPPPSKREQLHKLLEHGSVFVHLDPRRSGVAVPPWLAKKPQLVLQLGLNFPIPIRDLEIDEEGVRCTLSFNRAPFYCILPWSAVYALVGEDGQVTVWPADLPPELVPPTEAAPSSSAVRREAPRERRGRGQPAPAPASVVATSELHTEQEGATPALNPAARRPRLSVVPGEEAPRAVEASDARESATPKAEPKAEPREETEAPQAIAQAEPEAASLASKSEEPAPAEPTEQPASGEDKDSIVEPPPVARRGRERPSYLRVVK